MWCFLDCGLLLSRAPIHKEGLIKEAIRHIVWHSSTDLRSYYFIASPASSLATTGDFECKCSRFAGEKRKMIISAASVLRLLAGWNWMDGWMDWWIHWLMDGWIVWFFGCLVEFLTTQTHEVRCPSFCVARTQCLQYLSWRMVRMLNQLANKWRGPLREW